MRGDEKIKYIAQSGADFSKSELLVSKLSFTPNIAEDEEAEFICRFSHESANVTMDSVPAVCKVFARPEVSDIKEIPVSGEDEVKFTVDVSKFYPREIQIHWSHNGKQLKGNITEPHHNVSDGTYSVTNQIVISEWQLKKHDKIKITIERESIENPVVKEKTLQDPEEVKLPSSCGSLMMLEQTALRVAVDQGVVFL
nr:PREDICTED: signal-regulatory protein beta-1 isoform 3-like [Latimeria chalumnae]|eukprot:XP_014354388.1 PREDICTED: signal-regulatory protein beta-1 isoform 3-like [Latimeria chalumnae]